MSLTKNVRNNRMLWLTESPDKLLMMFYTGDFVKHKGRIGGRVSNNDRRDYFWKSAFAIVVTLLNAVVVYPGSFAFNDYLPTVAFCEYVAAFFIT